MAKRTNRVAWGWLAFYVAVVLAPMAVGGSALWFGWTLDRHFQRWSLDDQLRQAALGGDSASVKVLLIRGADVDALDERRATALMLATRPLAPADNEAVVRVLLDQGANVNARDEYGRTALMSAADWSSTAVVRLLLAYGAEVNARDHGGHSVLSYAAMKGRKEVIQLLEKATASVSATPAGPRTSTRRRRVR